MGPRTAQTPRSIRERAFHNWLERTLPAGQVGLLPLGDDAAAFRLRGLWTLVATTDSFSEGWHFERSSSPRAIGKALAAVNFSDLAAKGATPIGLLIDILVPRGTPSNWVKGIVLGAEEMCQSFDCHVVGGDTKPSRTRALAGTALGVNSSGKLAPRSGARVGDVVAVTGKMGRGGLAALAQGKGTKRRKRPHASFLDVRPRVREGALLAPRVHAMLDTSDGVAEATHLLAEASRAQITLEADSLPIDPALTRWLRSRARALLQAFYGGDYELLCSMLPAQFRPLQRALKAGGCPLTAIGRVRSGRGAFLEEGGVVHALPRAGWQPLGPE